MNQNPSDMTPEDHIAAGDRFLRLAQGPTPHTPHYEAERAKQGSVASAHYAAAVAKLALVTYERGPKPVEMVFTTRPVNDYPTA